LDINITLKNKSGVSYDPSTINYVAVYGVSGHQNEVDSPIWDRVYYIENSAVRFEADIDMNNKDIKNVDNLSMNNLSINKSIDMNKRQIKGLNDGNEDGDVPNIKQLNEVENNLNNNHALFLAVYNYIIKNESKVHVIKDLYFSDSREIKTANTYLFSNSPVSNSNNFTFYYVIKHNVMTIAFHWSKTNPDGTNSQFNSYNHVSKSQIKISINPLINELHLRLINIPNNA